MFTYPLTLADAIQAFVKFKSDPDTPVVFADAILNQLYSDEDAGLCTITIKQADADCISIRNITDTTLEITYLDPELEFVRKLAA